MWGLGGLLGVVLATLCLLLTTTTGVRAQSSVEPGLPLVPSFFQLGDQPEVSLDPLPERVTEGEDLTVTARLDRVVDFTVTVRLEIFGDINPSDYTLSQSIATIPAGELFTTFTINTLDDDVAEGDKFVLADLIVVSPTSGVGRGEGFRHFTLVDNEPTISLDELPMQITEGEGLTITARLNRALDFTITVSLAVNLFEGPPDFTHIRLLEAAKAIPAGDLFTTFTISTKDDGLADGDVYVEVSLNVVNPESAVDVTGGPRYFIWVDNAPRISLDPVPLQVTEGEALTVTARLNRVADFTVTVRLEVEISSGIGSPGYTLAQLTATIPAGDLFTTFTINTLDDDVVEGDKFGAISLSLIGSEPTVGVEQGFADFILVDNEPGVSLDPIVSQITEGDSLSVVARLDRVAADDVVVSLEVEIYGRIGSPDYRISPQTATIPAGELTAIFTLNTVDDDIAEGDEFGVLLLSMVGAGADM